jgi:hypothetical protein
VTKTIELLKPDEVTALPISSGVVRDNTMVVPTWHMADLLSESISAITETIPTTKTSTTKRAVDLPDSKAEVTVIQLQEPIQLLLPLKKSDILLIGHSRLSFFKDIHPDISL